MHTIRQLRPRRRRCIRLALTHGIAIRMGINLDLDLCGFTIGHHCIPVRISTTTRWQ